MDRQEKLRILRRTNPFVSVSAGDPWELTYPDVEDVNREPFEGLTALIREKSENPGTNCAGLVLGEVGSGKTHLISRLLEFGRRGDCPFVFAYVQPLEDPEQTFRYLLREIMVNLCRPFSGEERGVTALDLLLSRILVEDVLGEPSGRLRDKSRRTLERLRQDPVKVLDLGWSRLSRLVPRGTAFLRRSFGDIPRDMGRALFRYLDPERRADASNWLKGAVLDEEDAERLRVRSRSGDSAMALEQEARDVLIGLGRLLARYRIPLLTCFDRLENLETPEQVRAQGKMVELLVDSVKAVLPVIFARGLHWEETIRERLNQHVVSRLEANQFLLSNCTPEQALAVVRERLRRAFGLEELSDLYPFEQRDLREAFALGLSPREVIAQANRRLQGILREGPADEETAEEKLRRAFKSQVEAVRAHPDRYPPDRSRMRRALELYLGNAQEEEAVVSGGVRRPAKKDKYVDLELDLAQGRERGSTPRVRIIIDTELHHASVRAALKRGVQYLETEPNGYVLYIRDIRCGFPQPPRWKTTNETLREFREKGGVALFLEPDQAAAWYGLALVGYAVREGDVTLLDPESGTRSISWEEFKASVGSDLRDNGLEYVATQLRQLARAGGKGNASPLGREGSREVDVAQAADTAVRLLRTRPALMAPISDVAAELGMSPSGEEEKQLLRILEQNTDRFEIVRARDASLIKLKREWLHEQGERI